MVDRRLGVTTVGGLPPSPSTKYETGRLSADAILSSVEIVGTMPFCSILWIVAAETSARFLRVSAGNSRSACEAPSSLGRCRKRRS